MEWMRLNIMFRYFLEIYNNKNGNKINNMDLQTLHYKAMHVLSTGTGERIYNKEIAAANCSDVTIKKMIEFSDWLEQSEYFEYWKSKYTTTDLVMIFIDKNK